MVVYVWVTKNAEKYRNKREKIKEALSQKKRKEKEVTENSIF